MFNSIQKGPSGVTCTAVPDEPMGSFGVRTNSMDGHLDGDPDVHNPRPSHDSKMSQSSWSESLARILRAADACTSSGSVGIDEQKVEIGKNLGIVVGGNAAKFPIFDSVLTACDAMTEAVRAV